VRTLFQRQSLEADFELFLRENEDYDPKDALDLLLSHGLMNNFFIVRSRHLSHHSYARVCVS
jgi:hypothetical protein